MPHIDPKIRKVYDQAYLPFAAGGNLNYLITKLCLQRLGTQPRYVDFNEVIGVLECAKQELYRRMVAPYEDKKAKENGDVFPVECPACDSVGAQSGAHTHKVNPCPVCLP